MRKLPIVLKEAGLEEVRWSNPNIPDLKVQLDRASDHSALEFEIE